MVGSFPAGPPAAPASDAARARAGGRRLARSVRPVSLGLRAAVLLCSGGSAQAFHCQSDIALGPARASLNKGLALDDSSFRGCPGRIPRVWPNTETQVKSLRLFKAWRSDWSENDREEVWQDLRNFVVEQGAKVFIGTQITCDEDEDKQDWKWALQLMKKLGPSRVMGVSVGNEVDILFQKKDVDSSVTDDCIQELWEGGRLWRNFESRVNDMKHAGFEDVPVTSVFTGTALGGSPFMENSGQALVNSFLKNATHAAGRSMSNPFVFTFNFYPYFDPNYKMHGDADTCESQMAQATCWNASSCAVPQSVASVRGKAQQLTGHADSKVWIGETGWSSPSSTTLSTDMAKCKAWSSLDGLKTFYGGFLKWNMEPGPNAPDHAFYFTARDALNFGVAEHFGLISTCMDARCKLRTPGFVGDRHVSIDQKRVYWLSWVWLLAGVAVLVFALLCTALVGNCPAEPAGNARAPRLVPAKPGQRKPPCDKAHVANV